MLNPHLDDWWTMNKITRLSLDNDSLGGSGISIKVFIDSLHTDDYIFLSEIEGAYNDNLIILVLEKEKGKSLELEPHDGKGPISLWSQENYNLAEYKIPKELKIGYETSSDQFLGGYLWNTITEIDYKFFSHDNCFINFYPINKPKLEAFVQSVLRVHSYYHQLEIDWTDSINTLIALLKEKKSLEISSKDNNATVISFNVPSKNRLARFFGKKEKIEKKITITNGKAIWDN